jgi:1-phosphatidylinositol-3-phosphate 5-kinase
MVRVCNLCLVIMDEYDDDDDTRSVASAGTSSMPQSANPFIGDTAESPRTAQSPFAASQLFSFSRPRTELAAISEQHVQQQQRWRSDASERLSDDEPMNEDNAGSQYMGSLPATPDMRGRDFSRKPVGEQHNNVTHPLLQQMSPRATSRPPGDGAPFRRAIQEEDIDVVDDPGRVAHDTDSHPAPFSPEHAKAELASAIVSNGPEMDAIRSPRQRGADLLPNHQETQMRGKERSFITFPTLDDGASPQSRDVGSLLSPVGDHRKEPRTSLPPGLLRSRLSSRMSTSGLSSSLLSEVTGPNGMWRSRVDSFM